MRHSILALSFAGVLLAACSADSFSSKSPQFWRPISEPNVLLSSDVLEKKLAFDLSQCHCGIYPANATRSENIQFQPDRQRLAATSLTVTPDEDGQCQQKPSLVVAECMRQRGWEPTSCSGRTPLASGGSICASYVPSEDK